VLVNHIEPTPSAPPRRRRRDRARTFAAIVAAVLATAFVLSNTQSVRVHWLAGTTDAPLIIALAGAILLGVALGAFGARRVRRPPRK
jgi:uncharacterized integral membrane protein